MTPEKHYQNESEIKKIAVKHYEMLWKKKAVDDNLIQEKCSLHLRWRLGN